MKKRLYTAYGSNLNLDQMAMRCPTAKLVGTGVIQNYELQFKGRPQGAFATIAPKEGAMVPVAVWALEPKDEQALDWYEGYPSHYFKQDIRVQMSEVEIQAMVYIMDLKQNSACLPYSTIRRCGRGTRTAGWMLQSLTRRSWRAPRRTSPTVFCRATRNPCLPAKRIWRRRI